MINLVSIFLAQRDAIDQIFVMLDRANPLRRIPTNFMTRYFMGNKQMTPGINKQLVVYPCVFCFNLR